MKKYLFAFVSLLLLSSCDYIADKMGYTPKSNDYTLGVTVKQEEPKESQEEAEKRKYRDNIASYVEVYYKQYAGIVIENNTPYTIDKINVYVKYYGNQEKYISYIFIAGNSKKNDDTNINSFISYLYVDEVKILSIECKALGLY